MPTLTRKEVEEIAQLARVHLDASDVELMQSELGSILEHFGALAQVDTSTVQPMTHAVPMDLRLRPDEPAPSLPVGKALEAAPAKEGEFFVVPAILSSAGTGSDS
jgi:aspartyl-tRNA(Asn)/glutamyl-tRNA(Gln) amidotransferase subunit C